MDYKYLGFRIKRLRQEANMTQEKLAARAGLSASFLGHIERGSRKASLETLINIANALHTGTDRLLLDSLDPAITDKLSNDFNETQRKYMAEILRLLLQKIEA